MEKQRNEKEVMEVAKARREEVMVLTLTVEEAEILKDVLRGLADEGSFTEDTITYIYNALKDAI